MSEPFVYLWYIASTKRYYLGVAIGKPYYTHSSSSKELCDIVPHSSKSLLEERKEFWDKYERGEIEGVRYRILPKRFILNVPYLTEDLDDYGKMCEREHVLLKNRFERCWNRYYNMSLGDPEYVDLSGDNHWNWKGGITLDKNAYEKTPERRKQRREYTQRPERKERVKELIHRTPEHYLQHKEKKAKRAAKRRQTPKGKVYIKKYNDEWRKKNPEYSQEWNKKNPDYQKEYQQEWHKKNPDYHKERADDPVRKEKRRKNRPSQAGSKYMQEWRKKNPNYQKEHQAKKKAETQGEGTL